MRTGLFAPRRPAGEPSADQGLVSFIGSDAALLEGLRAGQASAIATLIDRYGRRVERVLVRIIGGDPELPDLLHDVLAGALGAVHQVRDPAALGDWLTSVAIFRARTFIKRRARRRFFEMFAPEDMPEPVAPARTDDDAAEALRCTYQVLARLPPDERIAFALRILDGMELTQVAGACRVSLATVKRRLQRAEARFKALAAAHPVLRDWVVEGARWGGPPGGAT